MKKYIRFSIIIILILLMGVGLAYLELGNLWDKNASIISTTTTPVGEVVCMEEAMQCPDGSYVSRSGPNCDFEACPNIEDFSQEGNLVFKNNDWYLIYEKPGAPALELKIKTNNFSSFKNGDRVRIIGSVLWNEISVTSIVKIEEKSCPQLAPIGPNFCSNGKIEAGIIGSDGCQLPPKCVVSDCVVGGCSGTLCGGPGEDLVSTCEYKEEYQCYKQAICERQTTGKCGWTKTPEFNACIVKY